VTPWERHLLPKWAQRAPKQASVCYELEGIMGCAGRVGESDNFERKISTLLILDYSWNWLTQK